MGVPPDQPGPRDWLRQTAGAAPPRGAERYGKRASVEAPPDQPGPRDWLRQTAGAAAPSGGRELHAVSDRGGSFQPFEQAGGVPALTAHRLHIAVKLVHQGRDRHAGAIGPGFV